MRKITIIVVAVFVALTTFCFFNRDSKAETCGGRCTGSSSCSACKNCSRCAHCSNGGTCGVCSGGSSDESSTPKKHYSSSSYSSSSHKSSNKSTVEAKKSVVQTYFVKTSILNIRKEPTKSSETVCVAKKKEKVKILKEYNDTWYYVLVLCNGKKVHGYITKNSVIKVY
ncbi:MAG: SH3 domain-containing protein [Bacteroidota bacterium]